MTVREVYEKAQSVEASIAYLQHYHDIVEDSNRSLHDHMDGCIKKACEFLQEYADKLYDTGSYA